MKTEVKLFGIMWDLRPVYWFLLSFVFLSLCLLHGAFLLQGEGLYATLSGLAVPVLYYVLIQVDNHCESKKGK